IVIFRGDRSLMERLPFTGVCSATNAFAVSDDARKAYLHDPKADVVVSIDLEKGNKKFLKWDDKNFAHRRWVCYSLFALTKDDQEYVSILFFNQHKKVFCLVHFIVNGELLVKVQTNALNTSTINKERLAYSVSKDGSDLQIIFYERFSSSASSPVFAAPPARLRFILCAFSPSTMRVTTTNGLLPVTGQWELPFISKQSLHFISTASTPHLFISYPRSEPYTWETSSPQSIGIMANEAGYPPRKALWCNAWSAGVGWFSVTEKIESDALTSRKMNLWKLDVESEWRWKKHAACLDAPEYTRSIALRLTPPSSSSSSFGFIHADWQYGEAAIFRVKLDSAQGPFRTSSRPLSDARLQVNESTSSADSDEDDDGLVLRRRTHRGRYGHRTPSREHLADLQCPICLDTYEDARTLNCGHSMCWECIEQMRISVKNETIRCPNCRAPTTIPPGGLPINYGLKDAIAALSRLVVTRRGCLRCVGCREKTETDKLWLCITCYRDENRAQVAPEMAADTTSTPIRRPTSLYLPSSSSSFSSSNMTVERRGSASSSRQPKRRGSASDLPTTPCTSAISEGRLNEHSGSSAQDQLLAAFAHCAACLLNEHAGHEYEGFTRIRDRAIALGHRREEYGRRAAIVVDEMRQRATQTIEDVVCAPLLQMVGEKLDALADVVIAEDYAEVDRRSEAVLAKLQEICNRFAEDAESILAELLECCNSDQPFSPRSRSQTSHRATEL
ncbi:hypothetical protein PMAYCL1PPCAC_00132, partial [Pristionchus mayeri]